MDTNDNKEELIEELSDVDTNEPVIDNVAGEIIPDKKIEDEIKVDVIQEPINEVEEKSETVALEDEKGTQDGASIEPKEKENYETVEQNLEEKPKKSKAPLIVLLSILLAIDVAALVIYIIGIDKVLGFIK